MWVIVVSLVAGRERPCGVVGCCGDVGGVVVRATPTIAGGICCAGWCACCCCNSRTVMTDVWVCFYVGVLDVTHALSEQPTPPHAATHDQGSRMQCGRLNWTLQCLAAWRLHFTSLWSDGYICNASSGSSLHARGCIVSPNRRPGPIRLSTSSTWHHTASHAVPGPDLSVCTPAQHDRS